MIPGLLSGPRPTFGAHWVERWAKGPDADRRIRQLRALLPTVQTRSVQETRRWSCEPGSDRTTIEAVEVSYAVPRGVEIPAPLPARVRIGGEVAL